MRDCRTVAELLARGEDKSPAIGAPKRKWLTYAELRALMERTVDALNAMGIGRNDRVAIVLNNGPEMASAFLSVAAGATTMPLNPGGNKYSTIKGNAPCAWAVGLPAAASYTTSNPCTLPLLASAKQINPGMMNR